MNRIVHLALKVDDLDNHKIITFGEPAPSYLLDVNWLEIAGRDSDNPRQSALQINSLTSIKRACLLGIGIAMLPDYIVGRDPGLLQLVTNADVPSFDTYFCYPDAMKNQSRFPVSQSRKPTNMGSTCVWNASVIKVNSRIATADTGKTGL